MLWVGGRNWGCDVENTTQIQVAAQKEISTLGLKGPSSVSATELLAMAPQVILATDKKGIYFLLLKLQD